MASQVPLSPFASNPVFSSFLDPESLPKISSPDDISIDATTTLYDSSSADQVLDDAEICHTISIIYNDLQSFNSNMPRRGVPADPNSANRRRKKRNRIESDLSPESRPKRRRDDDDAQSLGVGRRRRDKNASREREGSPCRSGDREARKSSAKARSSKASAHQASIIEESGDEIEPVLKISAHTRTHSAKKPRSAEKNELRRSNVLKSEVVGSIDDREHLASLDPVAKPTKTRSKRRVADDEHDVARKAPDRVSEEEDSVSDGSSNDSERSFHRRKASKSSRATFKKRSASETKVSKATIAKKSSAAGPSSSRRTSLQRKKQVRDTQQAQLRALGNTRKESSKHVRYTATMQKERDAMAAGAAIWKAEGAANTEVEQPESKAPIQHILEFANSASNASKFDLERQKSYNRNASRFTLAVIPNCDMFKDVDLMVYLVHTCEKHLRTLSDLCKHPEGHPELNADIDSLQCSPDSDVSWSEEISEMLISESQECAPPLIKNTSEAVHVIFRIIEKVINHGGGDTVEKFYRDWYDASLSSLTGQLAWYAIELWDRLHGDKADQKSSRLVDWSLCLASITFLFEMRQLPSFPKKVSESSLHLNLYSEEKPFDLPTAIRKGFKYLSKVSGFTRKGGSSFIDLVHSYFTALHCSYKKSEVVETMWNKVKSPNFAVKLSKEDVFWSAVVAAPLSSALNRGRVHESNSEIAFAVALLRYAPTCRAVFMRESKAREVILSLSLRILKEMSRDLLSFFEVIWDHKKDFRDGVTADDLVKIILKFGFSQRELMYSSNEWRNEYVDAIREIIMNAKKLAWLPLEHLALRSFYERGPFPGDSEFSLECDSMPTKTLLNSKEYDLRLYGFACLTWLIGSLGVSMEDGSHEISQVNTMNFLLSKTNSARISQQFLEMILTVQLHVEKFIYPGIRKRPKKTDVPLNVERMDLLNRDERNKFFSVLNIVRLRVRELKGLGVHKFDRELEMPVPNDKQEEGGLLESMVSALKGSTYLAKAATETFVSLDNDPNAVKIFAETLRDDGQQLLARFDPTSELSTRWVRLNRRNAYVGDARSQLTHGERAVGLSCTCVPGQTRSAAGEILQLGCSNDMCENRQVKIECGPGPCGAGETCKNRRLQNMDYAKTKHRKVADKGVGLFADGDIGPGSLIGEYQGEVLSQDEFRRRKREYRGERHFYFMTLTRNLVIDASRKSQITRFVNHSCDPNCVTEKWNAGGEPRVAIVALRNIPKGEEITFDYGAHSVGLDSAPCLCGSSKCRGKLAAAKKAPQVKEEGATIEHVEEKVVNSSSADMKDVEPVDVEDLQKYVDAKIIEGNEKIERAEKILRDIVGLEDRLGKSVDESKYDDDTRDKRAQRVAEWNACLDRLTRRDGEARSVAVKTEGKSHVKALSEVRASEAYRIPRLPQKPTEEKSDIEKVSVARQKTTMAQAPDYGKEKQKQSRFSGSEEFFADYRAKIRALQEPEITADGRPVDVNTHYVRGMNPAMAVQALELTVRSEMNFGPNANRHSRKPEPTQPKNSPFMPTKRMVKARAEKQTGPRRPIFAPRKRTGKYRNEDDSMDGYSTASSAEPIQNYKIPEIIDSDDDDRSAGYKDEFTPAPPLETLSYEQRERERFSRCDSRVLYQQDSEHVNHPMAPRRVGERAPQDSRTSGRSRSVGSNQYNESDDKGQQASRNWPYDLHGHNRRHGSHQQETRAHRSRFENTRPRNAEAEARRRAEDWHRQIYPHGLEHSQPPDVPHRREDHPEQQLFSSGGPSTRHERQGTEISQGSRWKHGGELSWQCRDRMGEKEKKDLLTHRAIPEPETKQHTAEDHSKRAQLTTDPQDSFEPLGRSTTKLTKLETSSDNAMVSAPKSSRLDPISNLLEPAAKTTVSLVASELVDALKREADSSVVQKPAAESSQSTVRRNRSLLGLRSKPIPLPVESDKVGSSTPTQARSFVSGSGKPASSEMPKDLDSSNAVSRTEPVSTAVESRISPGDPKMTSRSSAGAVAQISAPETIQVGLIAVAKVDEQAHAVTAKLVEVERPHSSAAAAVVKGHADSSLAEVTKTDFKVPEVSDAQPKIVGVEGSDLVLEELEVNVGAEELKENRANEMGGSYDKRIDSPSLERDVKKQTEDKDASKPDSELEQKCMNETSKSMDINERDSVLKQDGTHDHVPDHSTGQKRDRGAELDSKRSLERRCFQSPERNNEHDHNRNDGLGVTQSREKSPNQRQSRIGDHDDGNSSEYNRSRRRKRARDVEHERLHGGSYRRDKRPNVRPEYRYSGEDHSHHRSRAEHERNYGQKRFDRNRGGNYLYSYRDNRAGHSGSQLRDCQCDDREPLNASGWSEGEGHGTTASRERHSDALRSSGSALSGPQRESPIFKGDEIQRAGPSEALGGLRSEVVATRMSTDVGHKRDVGGLHHPKSARPVEFQDRPGPPPSRETHGRGPSHGSRNERHGGRKGQEWPREPFHRRRSTGSGTGSGLRGRERERGIRASSGGHNTFPSGGGLLGGRPHHSGIASDDGTSRGDHSRNRSRFSNSNAGRSETEGMPSFGAPPPPSGQVGNRHRSGLSEQGRGSKPGDLREILKGKGNKQ